MTGNLISDSQEENERLMRDRQEELRPQQADAEAAPIGEPPPEETYPPEPRIYVVQQGDTLSQIAKTAYGDATRWREIYEANKDEIKDPKIIRPGQELRIP